MKFNFPKQEEAVLVHLKFKPELFEQIKEIAEKEDCLRSDAIMVLLETSINEYLSQNKTEKIKELPKESSVDEDKHFKKDLAKTYKLKHSDLSDSSSNLIVSQINANCKRCGMSLVGDFANRRSKKSLNLCDSCDNSKSEDIEDYDGYISPAQGRI